MVSLQDNISEIVAILWMIFQPLLFGLIGAAVKISDIDGDTVGRLTIDLQSAPNIVSK